MAGGVSTGAESQSSGRSVHRLLIGMGLTVTAGASLRGNRPRYGGVTGAARWSAPPQETKEVMYMEKPDDAVPSAARWASRPSPCSWRWSPPCPRSRSAGQPARRTTRRPHLHSRSSCRTRRPRRRRSSASAADQAVARTAPRRTVPDRAVLSRRTSPPHRTPAPRARSSSSRATDRAGRSPGRPAQSGSAVRRLREARALLEQVVGGCAAYDPGFDRGDGVREAARRLVA